jgi:hypothetical protein
MIVLIIDDAIQHNSFQNTREPLHSRCSPARCSKSWGAPKTAAPFEVTRKRSFAGFSPCRCVRSINLWTLVDM